MDILHITPSSNGYREAKLIANRISRKNHLSLIEIDGEQFMTGGFLIKNTPDIRSALDSIPKEDQYDFVMDFKRDPFVKFYLDDSDN